MAAIQGEETTNQIASRFSVHPGQVRLWKKQMLDNASLSSNDPDEEKRNNRLSWTNSTGKLPAEGGTGFFSQKVRSEISKTQRKVMIEPDNTKLSRKRQCELLGISRSSTYYQPKGITKRDLKLMRAIDEQYLKTPYYGRRRICLALKKRGYQVSEKKVRRLMQLMGLETMTLGPSTPEHKVYPYLLRNFHITRPNQIWCTDITYISILGYFMYLYVIMECYSRKVLSRSLSAILDAEFCISCLERAIAFHGRPGIFTSDQDCQYTSEGFIAVLRANGIRISMDGRGSFLDNIFIERLWRSLKYELIYREFESVPDLRHELTTWISSYNSERFHQALNYQTPDEVYQLDLVV